MTSLAAIISTHIFCDFSYYNNMFEGYFYLYRNTFLPYQVRTCMLRMAVIHLHGTFTCALCKIFVTSQLAWLPDFKFRLFPNHSVVTGSGDLSTLRTGRRFHRQKTSMSSNLKQFKQQQQTPSGEKLSSITYKKQTLPLKAHNDIHVQS